MTKIFNLILLLILIGSCKQNKSASAPPLMDEKEVTSALIDVNRSIIKKNRDHITNFIKRTGWNLKETEDGIWFGILEAGDGNKVKDKDQIEYLYKLRLIDGSYPDKSEEVRSNTINIGSGGVESGLEKGLKLMSEGDSARIIVPPFFAHGNFGNQGDIPPGAILIFDIKLLKINSGVNQ